MTDLELMNLHIQVLYQQNKKGALTVINEPPFDAAPLVYLGVTAGEAAVYYSEQVDDLFKKRLQNIIDSAQGDLLVGLINQISNRVGLHEFNMGPVYVFPEIQQTDDEIMLITEENKRLLQVEFPYIALDFENKQPCVALMRDQKIVSLCCTARQSNAAAEASVYTTKEYRGRGFGAAVAQSWAQQIQRGERIALYSTTWDNFASQGVARKLKLRQYGTEISME